MATIASRGSGRVGEVDGASRERRIERRMGLPSGRAVLGGLLMAVAAVGTFLAYAEATEDDTVDVLVAARDLRSGETIRPDDVRVVAVELPSDVRGLFGSAEAALGRRIVGPVGEGEFLQLSSTVEPTPGEESLEVAIALPGTRAVGRLVAGERVDVFSTWGGAVTELIAVDARVLEVTGGSTTVLGGSEQVVVRLAVADFDQVEALVHAQAAGDITMIRSAIGSEVEDLGREYRPLATAGRVADDPDEDEEPAG